MLSVEAHLVDTIDHLIEYVAAAQGIVSMEVAGLGPSRAVTVVKARDKPVGLALQLTSCGVGTLVSEVTLTLTLTLPLLLPLPLPLTCTPSSRSSVHSTPKPARLSVSCAIEVAPTMVEVMKGRDSQKAMASAVGERPEST